MKSMLTATSDRDDDEDENDDGSDDDDDDDADDDDDDDEDDEDDEEAEEATNSVGRSLKLVGNKKRESKQNVSRKPVKVTKKQVSLSGTPAKKGIGTVSFETESRSSSRLFVDTGMNDKVSPPKRSSDGSTAVRFDSPEVATLQVINPDETANEDTYVGQSEEADAKDELEEEVPRPLEKVAFPIT